MFHHLDAARHVAQRVDFCLPVLPGQRQNTNSDPLPAVIMCEHGSFVTRHAHYNEVRDGVLVGHQECVELDQDTDALLNRNLPPHLLRRNCALNDRVHLLLR